MLTAELVIIGSEFLLGESLDTNSRTLARALRDLGIDLLRIQVVKDAHPDIIQAVRAAMEKAAIVITTGGLGPTVDDPTRQAIAAALGVELEFRPELWEQVTARLARYGRQPSENQRRQAYLPRGALAIENPVGTAPAFLFEKGLKTLVALPGVPREMETLLADRIIPYLRSRYNIHAMTKVRTLHVAGLAESAVDERIGEFEQGENPAVGMAAHAGLIDIRLAARAEDETSADQMLRRLEDELRRRLGEAIFGADGETLEAVTLAAVAARGWTLSTCEAGTDGVLQKRLSACSGTIYRGGEQCDPQAPFSLPRATKRLQKKYHSQLALGAWLRTEGEQYYLEVCLYSPAGVQNWQFSYGGHPAYAAHWAANLAMDCLRRSAIQTGKS